MFYQLGIYEFLGAYLWIFQNLQKFQKFQIFQNFLNFQNIPKFQKFLNWFVCFFLEKCVTKQEIDQSRSTTIKS